MALTNPEKVVTEQRLNEYHNTILPYLGGNSMVACGGGYAPLGTIIAFMGMTAPSDFLACDGTVYNIADYEELSDFIELQFGSANYFGGNGTTTFAVPDLRGEFLRGTGTNGHSNQGNGSSVGVHQDGTEFPSSGANPESINAWINNGERTGIINKDSTIQRDLLNRSVLSQQSEHALDAFTSRPTNTSVLYCIKAKSQGNGYSLDEQIVGTWIDGKPIYQITFTGLSVALNSTSWVVAISDVSSLHIEKIKYVFAESSTESYSGICGAVASNQLKLFGSGLGGARVTTITIQYTKTTD